MSCKMSYLRILIAAMIGVMVFSAVKANSALAQEDRPPKDTACIDCHQEQYFLFDHGKWYCLCETQVRCTECHGGRADTAIADLAHEGMITNPLEDDAAVCQDCHPQDYQAKVEKYASIAGDKSTPLPCPTCTPSALVSQVTDQDGGTPILRTLPPGPWQAVGLGFLGIAFLAVFLFACRCWKLDHCS